MRTCEDLGISLAAQRGSLGYNLPLDRKDKSSFCILQLREVTGSRSALFTLQTKGGARQKYRPVIPALGKLRQDRELRANLGYIVMINTRGEQHLTQRLDPQRGT